MNPDQPKEWCPTERPLTGRLAQPDVCPGGQHLYPEFCGTSSTVPEATGQVQICLWALRTNTEGTCMRVTSQVQKRKGYSIWDSILIYFSFRFTNKRRSRMLLYNERKSTLANDMLSVWQWIGYIIRQYKLDSGSPSLQNESGFCQISTIIPTFAGKRQRYTITNTSWSSLHHAY